MHDSIPSPEASGRTIYNPYDEDDTAFDYPAVSAAISRGVLLPPASPDPGNASPATSAINRPTQSESIPHTPAEATEPSLPPELPIRADIRLHMELSAERMTEDLAAFLAPNAHTAQTNKLTPQQHRILQNVHGAIQAKRQFLRGHIIAPENVWDETFYLELFRALDVNMLLISSQAYVVGRIAKALQYDPYHLLDSTIDATTVDSLAGKAPRNVHADTVDMVVLNGLEHILTPELPLLLQPYRHAIHLGFARSAPNLAVGRFIADRLPTLIYDDTALNHSYAGG